MSLSRRGLYYASLIILLAILGLWAGPPLANFWYWPTLLFLIAIAIERWRSNKQYRCTRLVSQRMALGQSNHYQLSFTNQSQYKLTIETQPDYPETWIAERQLSRWQIAAGASQSKSLTLTPTKLGKTALGTLYIRELGAYGLIWWTRRFDDDINVNITVATLAHDLTISGRSNSGHRRSRLKPGSGFELLALRDYQPGDPLRAIDWKATAKRAQPMVRIFAREQQLEMVILIDCSRTSRIHCQLLDRLHHYVNIASRLAEFAIANGDRVASIAYASQTINIAPIASGMKALRQTRELLNNLASTSEDADPLSVALQVQQLLKRRGLIIFLTEIDELDASAQMLKAVQLLSLKHQVMVASIADQAITKLTQITVKHWLDPYQNLAALEYQQGRQITRNKLQRQGVSVVSTGPDQIDQQVLQRYQKLRDQAAI